MWLSFALCCCRGTAAGGAGAVFRTLKKLGAEAAGGQHTGVLGPRVMEFCAASQGWASAEDLVSALKKATKLYLINNAWELI